MNYEGVREIERAQMSYLTFVFFVKKNIPNKIFNPRKNSKLYGTEVRRNNKT